MSRGAFAAEVEAVLGATPGDDLLRGRVSMSQTTPRGGAPVKLISDDLGYARPAAFFRGFAQVAETSPRAWMKDI